MEYRDREDTRWETGVNQGYSKSGKVTKFREDVIYVIRVSLLAKSSSLERFI